MSELRLDDLQPRKQWTAEDIQNMSAAEVEKLGLTPEEVEEIFGAGRPGFMPGMEALEAREMMDAGLGRTLAQIARPDASQAGRVRTLATDLVNASPVNQQHSGAANTGATHGAGSLSSSALDSFFSKVDEGAGIRLVDAVKGQDIKLPAGVTPVSAKVQWGEWKSTADGYQRTGTGTDSLKYEEKVNSVGTDFTRTTTKADTSYTAERWYMSGNDTLTSFEAFNASASHARVVYGRYEGGSYKFETWDGYRTGVQHSIEFYDKAPQSGGKVQKNEVTNTDGTGVIGGWKDGKWAETTTDTTLHLKIRFAVYQDFGTTGTGVGLLSVEDYNSGNLERKQTNHTDGSSVIESFNTNGIVTRREAIAADHKSSVIESFDDSGKLTRRATTHADTSSVTESFDASGNLIQRVTFHPDGSSVTESFNAQQIVTRRATVSADHKSWVTETFDDAGKLTRKETLQADGPSMTESLDHGKVTRRETVQADKSSVIESFDAQEKLTQKITQNTAGTTVIESYFADGTSVSKRTTIQVDGASRMEEYDQHGNKVTVFESHSSGQTWVEEQWVVGRYTKTIWASKDHKISDLPIMQIVIQGSKMTVTRYNVPSNYWWHEGEYSTNSATLTWVYAFNSGEHPNYGSFGWVDEKDRYGGLEYHNKVFEHGDLTDFVIAAPDGTTNHWYRETGWNAWGIRGYWETPDDRVHSNYGRYVNGNIGPMQILSNEVVGELNVHGGGI